MQESDLPGLAAQVLWATFGLAVAFGAIAQRTHFCTMGAVADIVNNGDWGRMRMWLLAIAVGIIGAVIIVVANHTVEPQPGCEGVDRRTLALPALLLATLHSLLLCCRAAVQRVA